MVRVKRKLKTQRKNQTSTYEPLCSRLTGPEATGPCGNQPLDRSITGHSPASQPLDKTVPTNQIHDNTRKTNTQKTQSKKATMADLSRKQGSPALKGPEPTGPGTTRARLPASRFARFLLPAQLTLVP